MTRVLISGCFGLGRYAHEAALASILRHLAFEIDDLRPVLISVDPRQTELVHGVEAVGWDDMARIGSEMAASRLVVIGGCDTFSDRISGTGVDGDDQRSFGVHRLTEVAVLATMHDVPVMIFGVGVGPPSGDTAVLHVRTAFELASAATVADEASLRELGKLGVDAGRVELGADPSLSQEQPDPSLASAVLKSWGVAPMGRTLLGLMLSSWRPEEEGPEAATLGSAVAVFADAHDADIVLLADVSPGSPAMERAVLRELRQRVASSHKVRRLSARMRPSELASVAAQCSLLLGLGRDAAVLAHGAAVPTVRLNPDPTETALLSRLHLDEQLMETDCSSERSVLEAMDRTWSARHDLVEALNTSREEADRLCRRAASVAASLPGGQNSQPGRESREIAGLIGRTAFSLYLADAVPPCDHQLEEEKSEAEETVGAEGHPRGRLHRAVDWVVLPREEGRLTFYLRSIYFAAARLIGGLLRPFSKRPKGEETLANRFQYRFMRVKRIRNSLFGRTVSTLRCPSVEGLVSVVLPVHNGEKMVGEAIESVLAQTFRDIELIIVDDGSTDGTPKIVDAYADRDKRIHVIHQENRKLPRSLSRGVRAARGQFLTWTSDDNRMKADCLEKMVGCLKRQPEWDLVYANLDIIGTDGEFLNDSPWYEGYQQPPGSAHIHLPANEGELNIWPENHIGGAFLYRDRVACLLGDYSPHRFTAEDYDYWMLVNELLTLRHADFADPVYDYRFHDASLTSRGSELKLPEIQRDLMVFDDFRRDSGLAPLIWITGAGVASGTAGENLAGILRRADDARHHRMEIGEIDPSDLPSLWFPAVYLEWADDPSDASADRDALPTNCMTVLVTDACGDLPSKMPGCWDFCITAARDSVLVASEDRFQGWFGLADPKEAFTAIEIRARMHHWRALEEEIHSRKQPELLASVVVCTYKRPDSLMDTLRSVAAQSIPRSDYEVLLVNNDPAEDLGDIVEDLRRTHFSDNPERLRLIQCPLKGLSHARNAGISEARGVVVCFIDDDAVAAPDWIEATLAAYEENPDAGVVGGKILLTVPDQTPRWFNPDAWRYWSYFPAKYESTTEVVDWWKFPWGANWTARREVLLKIGGFRHGYGRKGKDFGAGEEVIAASLARDLGHTVLIEPRSAVQHNVDPARFTKRDLRKLITAGLLTNYFMQRDLYTPAWQNLRNVARDLAGHSKRLLAFPWLTRFKRMEARYFILGELRLLGTVFRDYMARLSHDL